MSTRSDRGVMLSFSFSSNDYIGYLISFTFLYIDIAYTVPKVFKGGKYDKKIKSNDKMSA
jgi:hypothetical protein